MINKTRDKLITDNWPYAATVAMNQGLPLEDISVAAEALILAIDGYDPSRGAKLQTHITNRVKFAVTTHFGRIHAHRKTHRHEYLKVMFGIKNAVDIDSLSDSIELSYNGTEQKVCNKDMAVKILEFAKGLDVPYNAYNCLRLFYIEDMGQPEIGEKYGVVPSQVCNINKKAIKKIRAEMENWR